MRVLERHDYPQAQQAAVWSKLLRVLTKSDEAVRGGDDAGASALRRHRKGLDGADGFLSSLLRVVVQGMALHLDHVWRSSAATWCSN